jgi:hypothetical protein
MSVSFLERKKIKHEISALPFSRLAKIPHPSLHSLFHSPFWKPVRVLQPQQLAGQIWTQQGNVSNTPIQYTNAPWIYMQHLHPF